MGYLIFYVIIFIVIILVMRVVGAWMLRINEVIEQQHETNKLLKKLCMNVESKENKKVEEEKIIEVTLTDKELEDKKLGISYNELSGDVKIDNIETSSSCYKSGLRVDDIIVSLNGKIIRRMDDLTNEIKKIKNTGSTVYNFEKR